MIVYPVDLVNFTAPDMEIDLHEVVVIEGERDVQITTFYHHIQNGGFLILGLLNGQTQILFMLMIPIHDRGLDTLFFWKDLNERPLTCTGPNP
jgi:hypothetical protein